jgi:hypothetical protein
MPMLRKLPKAYRIRIQSAAVDMMRLHGEKAIEVAREASTTARGKHQRATARYWSLVATALTRNDTFPPAVPPTMVARVDAVIE